ncbi:membrane protein [Streptomyces sp. NRRL B-1347]|uniref:membrane protein n=1 Tax=Streptomyces sp. NRRL B-1347 TaxID=1476877 RepID=UPI0004CC829C|nr:membrane protein [Streptomyces sp. NRRL B-1347]
MDGWWYRNVVEPGKLPLLLALVSFVGCFLVTRTITRLIRAGKGPFRNITTGSVHVHHVVPGIFLMLVGGFWAVAAGRHSFGSMCAAVIFGVGAGLVLDEFALILHLDDVYWSEQGRKSVEVVILTAALVVLILTGFTPFGVNEISVTERHNRFAFALNITVNCAFALIALLKGKLRTALIGMVVPFVALVGAIRLARPGSAWARRFYRNRPRVRARAGLRAFRHDRRWTAKRRWLQDAIGGRPDPEPRSATRRRT